MYLPSPNICKNNFNLPRKRALRKFLRESANDQQRTLGFQNLVAALGTMELFRFITGASAYSQQQTSSIKSITNEKCSVTIDNDYQLSPSTLFTFIRKRVDLFHFHQMRYRVNPILSENSHQVFYCLVAQCIRLKRPWT